jgi:cytochrome P450
LVYRFNGRKLRLVCLRVNGGRGTDASLMRNKPEISFDLPGPRADSVAGQRRIYARFVYDPVKFLTQTYQRFGALSGMNIGPMRVVFAFGPELNRQILSDPDLFHSFGLTVPGPAASSQWRMGYGMFRQDSHTNARRRKMLSPMLSRQAVESHLPEMAQIVGEMLDGWRPGQTIEITDRMRDLSLSAACRVLFGLNPEGRWRNIGKPIERWMRTNSSVGARLSTATEPSSGYRRMLGGADRLQEHVKELISSAGAGGNLMATLLGAHAREKENLDKDELLGQTSVLLAAAYETTAMALTWSLFLLAQHPEVSAALLTEIQREMTGDVPTAEELDRLDLLDGVIKESLRLFPPACFGARVVASTTTLGDVPLAKGTNVFFSHYVTHRLPEIFSDPGKFKPQRWKGPEPSQFQYMPFGAGPRRCIGGTYSKFVIKLAVAMIFKRFRLTVEPGAVINRSVKIILFPKRGIPMMVAAQDGQFRAAPVRGNINEMVDWETAKRLGKVKVTLPASAGRGLPSIA